MSRSRQPRCRCIRSHRGNPKVAASLCHGAGFTYHPSVVERIAGRRLAQAWRVALRALHPDDVDL